MRHIRILLRFCHPSLSFLTCSPMQFPNRLFRITCKSQAVNYYEKTFSMPNCNVLWCNLCPFLLALVKLTSRQTAPEIKASKPVVFLKHPATWGQRALMRERIKHHNFILSVGANTKFFAQWTTRFFAPAILLTTARKYGVSSDTAAAATATTNIEKKE